MKACIITIGDEILIGQILDTNSAWIAEKLALLGIQTHEIVSISDNPGHIKDTLKRYEGKMDIIITTGGLGPTRDDLTKSTLAEYFGSEMILNQEVLTHIENLFSQRGIRVTEINKLQAMVPKNCKILNNPSGTAPGMWFKKGGSVFVALPGVPYELMDIFNVSLLPELKKIFKGNTLVHRTIMTQGIPESILAEKIKNWEEALPKNFKLAYLPHPGIVRLRITASVDSTSGINELIENEIDKLQAIIGSEIFSTEDENLEKVIGVLLKMKGLTVAVAESCTGGFISKLFTSVPGSSEYFKGSVIAYDNLVKEQILKIEKSLILEYGAVSKEVVEAMAISVRKLMGVDVSIATSGIAGPDGGTTDKPVGTTWIAVSDSGQIISHKFLFGEHRGRNIEKASLSALNMLRKLILKHG